MGLVERSVRRRAPCSMRRLIVIVCSRPSRRLAAAPGWFFSKEAANASSAFLAFPASVLGQGGCKLALHPGALFVTEIVKNVPHLVNLTPLDWNMIPEHILTVLGPTCTHSAGSPSLPLWRIASRFSRFSLENRRLRYLFVHPDFSSVALAVIC